MNEPQLSKPADKVPTHPRTRLLRDGAVLQMKLLIDGLRDAALFPLALLATLLGLLRGGEDADSELQRVIKLGRRSERWINLFGRETPPGRTRPGSSLDQLLERVEDVVLEQYGKGRTTHEARAAIAAALRDNAAGDSPKRDSDAI